MPSSPYFPWYVAGVGWGYDHWMYLYCKGWRSVNFKAGIIDDEEIVHGVLPDGLKAQIRGAPLVDGASAAAMLAHTYSRKEAMLAHTYSRKEAQEAKDEMAADMTRRGLGRMHAVDQHAHGWLTDAPPVKSSVKSWIPMAHTRVGVGRGPGRSTRVFVPSRPRSQRPASPASIKGGESMGGGGDLE